METESLLRTHGARSVRGAHVQVRRNEKLKNVPLRIYWAKWRDGQLSSFRGWKQFFGKKLRCRCICRR